MKIVPRRDQSYGLESRLQALLHINLLARVTKALKVSENRPIKYKINGEMRKFWSFTFDPLTELLHENSHIFF